MPGINDERQTITLGTLRASSAAAACQSPLFVPKPSHWRGRSIWSQPRRMFLCVQFCVTLLCSILWILYSFIASQLIHEFNLSFSFFFFVSIMWVLGLFLPTTNHGKLYALSSRLLFCASAMPSTTWDEKTNGDIYTTNCSPTLLHLLRSLLIESSTSP